MNWNFKFARTTKIFSKKFTQFEKCQRLLPTFANINCNFFTINVFIDVCYYV